MANEDKVKRAYVFQSMACPQCPCLELEVPPENWEVIEDGTKAHCPHCKSDFEIRFELQDPRLRNTNEAELGTPQATCPKCKDNPIDAMICGWCGRAL